MKMFYSPAEAAQVAKDGQIPSFPWTKQGAIKLIKREQWRSVPDMCRKRKGAGGGFEFHITHFESDFQSHCLSKEAEKHEIAHNTEQQALETQRKK